jgi:predicted ferric reductase
MNEFWWYLTRSTGIVATVLAVAALVWGFFFSSRNTGTRRRPNWWLDLHNYLGGLSLVFIGVHIAAAYLDANSGIGLLEVFVPGTYTAARWAIGWGVIATYAFALTVFTSWPKRRFSRKVWRAVHLTSVGAVALTMVHALQAGSDGTTFWLRAVVVAGVACSVYALSVRLIDLVARRVAR